MDKLLDVFWPVLAPLLGVAVGSLVAIRVSENALRANRRERERSIERAIEETLRSNLTRLAANSKMAAAELELLAQAGQRLLGPLDVLEGNLLQLLLIEPPTSIVGDDDQFGRLREIDRLTDRYINLVAEREGFIIANQALSSITKQIEQYDGQISRASANLEALIREFLSHLSP